MSGHLTRLWRMASEKARTRLDAAREERDRLVDYRRTFSSDYGQRVLADMLRRGGVMQSSFVAGDPQMTAFREGRRRVALEIIETINRNPEAVDRMIRTGQIEEIIEHEPDAY